MHEGGSKVPEVVSEAAETKRKIEVINSPVVVAKYFDVSSRRGRIFDDRERHLGASQVSIWYGIAFAGGFILALADTCDNSSYKLGIFLVHKIQGSLVALFGVWKPLLKGQGSE